MSLRGFTVSTHDRNVRPGGYWTYTMHGPDRMDHENNKAFLAFETCSKLVHDHDGNEKPPPLFRVAVQFLDVGGQTEVDVLDEFLSDV